MWEGRLSLLEGRASNRALMPSRKGSGKLRRSPGRYSAKRGLTEEDMPRVGSFVVDDDVQSILTWGINER